MGSDKEVSSNRNHCGLSRRAGKSDAPKKAKACSRRASVSGPADDPRSPAPPQDEHCTGQTQWVDQLRDGGQLERIFEHIPHVLFFAKDLQGRNRMCNQALIEHLGLKHKSQLLGRTDAEYHPRYMAEKYYADDLVVVTSKTPLLHIIELFPARNGLPELYLTHKFPMFDRQNNVVGICGIIVKLDNPLYTMAPYQELTPVLQYIREHYKERIYIPELADLMGMSVRQFQRRFVQIMRYTPSEYIIRFRILRAADQLANTTLSITRIAIDNGFYDHSSFVRHFKRQLKETPHCYRRFHAEV